MSKSSPTRPLSGQSIVANQRTRTVYESDGMPRTNEIPVPPWRADPTLRRAFALIEAQRRRRKRADRVNQFGSSC